MKRLLLVLSVLITTTSVFGQTKLSIIPLPKVLQENNGNFKLSSKTIITYNSDNLASLVEYTRQIVFEASGIKPAIIKDTKAQKTKSIRLILDTSLAITNEAYIMDVTPATTVIKAKTENGIFYGIQTLLQVIPVNDGHKIPALHIEDEPRFSWRGMMFDNSRHMFSVDFIKRFIDQLAYHKLNKFHWHLTEDQGWRIEIKKYPRLQEIAAWRNGTQYGPDRKIDVDSVRYGGYYTQEQIKEVVAYAASRYIEVIPEIEMPGHSVAAISAYPHLACNDVSFETGKPFETRKVWGVSKDLYCAGNDMVFTFLEDVLTEVMTLFPSSYIHIGGDEAPHDAWRVCPKCQQRMKDEGLKNEEELQSWFIRRIEKFVNGKGKRVIGWEEIMQGGLTPNATVHSWLGTKSGLKASQLGNNVIMSPYSHLYFDGYQADPKIEPLAIGYWVPLDTVYAFEPRHAQMSDKDANHLLGAQANLWTEFITTPEYFDYMVFPRMDALAEITWTPKEKKDFSGFQRRLKTQFKRYDKMKVNYRIPIPQLNVRYTTDSTAIVTLIDRTGSGYIRYEVDEEKVSFDSPVYKEAIEVKPGETLRFASFSENGRASSTDYFPRRKRK